MHLHGFRSSAEAISLGGNAPVSHGCRIIHDSSATATGGSLVSSRTERAEPGGEKMTKQLILLACAVVVGVSTLAAQQAADPSYAPQRVNRAIELLEQGQPIYYAQVNGGGYDEGKELAQTWADYITYNLEHSPFNMTELRGFMQGLVDGGPTKSGHRTPTVVAVLPVGGINEAVMWSNYWMVEQVLGSGVHGVLLVHVRSPAAVKVLVQASRYPHAPKTEGIGEGLRGSGGQGFAARIWGVSPAEYQRIAEPWPLNPDGELLIGLKIEDRHALEHAEASTAVPGVGFADRSLKSQRRGASFEQSRPLSMCTGNKALPNPGGGEATDRETSRTLRCGSCGN